MCVLQIWVLGIVWAWDTTWLHSTNNLRQIPMKLDKDLSKIIFKWSTFCTRSLRDQETRHYCCTDKTWIFSFLLSFRCWISLGENQVCCSLEDITKGQKEVSFDNFCQILDAIMDNEPLNTNQNQTRSTWMCLFKHIWAETYAGDKHKKCMHWCYDEI